jgi:hypothetical protein
VFAQRDLRIEFVNYTSSQVVTGSVGTSGLATGAINIVATITNDGPTIAAGDTIVYGHIINGQVGLFGPSGFIQNNFEALVLNLDLATGQSFSTTIGLLKLEFGTATAAGTQRTFCVYAALVGSSVWGDQSTFDLSFNADATTANNSACVSYELNGTVINDQVGLAEDLKKIANKTFITNNRLIIENNDVDFKSAAIINVINISGQVVSTENRVIQGGRNTIKLNNLSAGIYVVSIQVEDEISTTKVMVK